MSYALGISLTYASSSKEDLESVQFFSNQLPIQYILLSGGVNGSESSLSVSIEDSYGGIQKVKTNSVMLFPETAAQTLDRLNLAVSQVDFSSAISLSLALLQNKDLSEYLGKQIINAVVGITLNFSGNSPSVIIAQASLETLYFSSLWAIQDNIYNLNSELESMCSLIIWLTTSSKMCATPISLSRLSHFLTLADNIYLIASNKAKYSGENMALVRTTLDRIRITSFQASIVSWTAGQSVVQESGGLAFKKTIQELLDTTFVIGHEIIGETLDPLYSTVLFPSFLPSFLAAENGYVAIVLFQTDEAALRPANLVIVTEIVTVALTPDLASQVSQGCDPPHLINLSYPVLLDLVYNLTFLPAIMQQRIVSQNAFQCLWWKYVNSTSEEGRWVSSVCSVVSVKHSLDLSGSPVGVGSVQCSCTQLGTFAAAIDELALSLMENLIPAVLLVEWAPGTPQNSDELVVVAGDTLNLRISANSVTASSWNLAGAAPSELIIVIGTEVVGTDDESASISTPFVSESFVGLQYIQLTEWTLRISSVWTLELASSGMKDIEIRALLVGESSGGRLRTWTLRILECEVLVGAGDTLDSISSKYGTTPSIVFGINPVLATMQSLQSPLQEKGMQWTCSANKLCSLSGELAAGMRIRIGRMFRVQRNSSLVQQVRQMGGSVSHIAKQNLGRITTVSTFPLVFDLNIHSSVEAADICIVLNEEATC